MAIESSPNVHGMARQISVDTGVGKADSDGPKSATATRIQNATYCCHRLPCRPYSSRRASRVIWTACGSDCEKRVAAAIAAMIGSIGVAWVTKKAMLMPTKTTRTNWPNRLRT